MITLTKIFHAFLRGAFALFALNCAVQAAPPVVQTTMSSRFLARGETATLDIGIISGTPDGRIPTPPVVPDVKIEGMEPRRMPFSRRAGISVPFEVSSYKVGHHVIPGITIRIDGSDFTTQPIEFTVYDPEELQWSKATVGQQTFRYAVGIHMLKENPYEGEVVPVEIKLYVPEDLPVADWGIPEFERDGVACWRFEPSERGSVLLLGQHFVGVGYPSSMSATRSGPVSLGPVNLRLMTEQVVIDGYARRAYMPANLVAPKFDFQAKKLPEGAPEGFKNAIGHFTMSATTTQKEIREKDPLAVDVSVTGTGNLDAIEAPMPKDTEGWKMYESGAAQRGDERRQESGTVTFHQFMMPLTAKAQVPAFKLVYFDPTLVQYKTIETAPITLTVLPALKSAEAAAPMGPPPAVNMPVETMSDILGLIQSNRLVLPPRLSLPEWVWHVCAGIVALLLLIKAIWMRAAPKLRLSPITQARRDALRDLERTDTVDQRTFLRKAGHFIEQWLGEASTHDPALHAILEERDATCYRSDPVEVDKAGRSRRSAILKILKKAAWLWVAMAWFGLSGVGKAAEPDTASIQEKANAAYEASDYERAIQLWLDAGPFDRLSAETLYNIGNACYRMGSSGNAALYYRRALTRDSSQAEARQNLRFIERKNGSITVQRPDYQYALARWKLSTWKNIVWTGAWMVGLALLACLATRPASWVRVPAVIALIAGPIFAAFGTLGWHYYPDDSLFAPLERQAVVVGEKVLLHVEASRTSSQVSEAPEGSLCEILEERGRWFYVAFATNTRGWVPKEDVERVVPIGKPGPPKLQKPKEDAQSA